MKELPRITDDKIIGEVGKVVYRSGYSVSTLENIFPHIILYYILLIKY